MSDIFISYSSKDREQAEQLSELLGSAGLSVWIDKSGIDIATSWSGEIVDAINDCKAFVVLLSPNSIESHNVIKEVSLASEKRKKILPLDLEPVTLTRDFEYQLAGIQRAPMTDIDAILRALEKIGVARVSTRSQDERVETRSTRKTLMILPFEDLSPAADNAWFADGLATELIGALSYIKALRVSDHQATKEYKRYQGSLMNYARTMNIRYFIEGQVRKFEQNIKISITLLDIETGDHLWQDSMKGTMNDIFDIQEKVAEKVVEGLKVHLASDEKKKLAERDTENAEAYELYLKADEYFSRNTKEGYRLAVQLTTEALHLDPGYAQVYQFKANSLAAIYRSYDRNPAILEESETLLKEALRLKPDLFAAYQPLSHIYMHRGMHAEAEEAAREFIRKDPQSYLSHSTLGFFYNNTGQYAKAIAPFEESVRLKPDNLIGLWNLVVSCDSAGEHEQCAHWAAVSLPQFERRLKLRPDDETMLVMHGNLLQWSGRTEAAYAAAIALKSLKDGGSLYNTACLFGKLGDKAEAFATFRKAIEAGFKNIRILKGFLTDEKEGIVSLAGTSEYEEVRGMVEALEGIV